MKLILEIPEDMKAQINEKGNVIIDIPDAYYWNGYKNIWINYLMEYQHSENKRKRIYNGNLQFNEYGNKFFK